MAVSPSKRASASKSLKGIWWNAVPGVMPSVDSLATAALAGSPDDPYEAGPFDHMPHRVAEGFAVELVQLGKRNSVHVDQF
jgi:hypothetical protein